MFKTPSISSWSQHKIIDEMVHRELFRGQKDINLPHLLLEFLTTIWTCVAWGTLNKNENTPNPPIFLGKIYLCYNSTTIVIRLYFGKQWPWEKASCHDKERQVTSRCDIPAKQDWEKWYHHTGPATAKAVVEVERSLAAQDVVLA